MHKELLNQLQTDVLPLISGFNNDFGLVGGTAIALHLGHRKSIDFEGIIKTPDLLSLAAMKAYTLGRRSKWKDYIDLFFIFKQYSLKQVCDKAKQIFKEAFNEKLFREQLMFFNDIDFTEKIDYVPEFLFPDEEIKNTLQNISLSNID